MKGPVYGLCTAGAGHPLCEGLGDLVGRLSMSLPSGLLVACLAGNPWLGLSLKRTFRGTTASNTLLVLGGLRLPLGL